jgi:cystathionine beta-lyase/cystathionine gamma-synthase
MKHGSGLFTMLIKARDVEQVELFCNSLKKFLMAVSWGGHESLLMPACSFPVQQHYKDDVYPFNLIRFYIGLEDAESLMEDLSQAFDKIK